MESKITRTIGIVNSKGLHARAAAKLCGVLEKFDAEVLISKGTLEVLGCSIMGLLMLGAKQGSQIILKATGPESEKALEAACQLIESGFDEN
jgi:phosphocarrier protein HPr